MTQKLFFSKTFHSCVSCILPDSVLLTYNLSFSLYLQGDNVRKGQFNEFWEPGDRLWSDAYAATGAECFGNPEWHEAAETCSAAYDRAWRRLILRTEECRPYSRNKGQLFIVSKRKFKPPWWSFRIVCNQIELEKLVSRMTVLVEVGLVLPLSCYCKFWGFHSARTIIFIY